jgi:transposase InsO family protein
MKNGEWFAWLANGLNQATEVAIDRWRGNLETRDCKGFPFAYLPILIDRFSRMVVGWQMRRNMTEQLVLEEIQKSIGYRTPQQSEQMT